MPVEYKVLDVNQRQRYTPGGTKVAFYDISVQTARGSTGTLRIDTADYNPAKVKQLLDEFAETLDFPFTM